MSPAPTPIIMSRYPAFLESYWISRAHAVAGEADRDEALEKLRPAVQALSDLFTVERPGEEFPDYAADPAKRIAYGLFFFPQSFVRCDIAMDAPLHFRGWRPAAGDGPVRILDLGSASGPCGLAAALRLADVTGRRIHLVAVDHSRAALDELATLARVVPEIAAKVTVETRVGDLRKTASIPKDLPPQDFVTLGFSANEIFAGRNDAERLRSLEEIGVALAPEGLMLVLEPALRETAAPLRRVRDATLAGPHLFPWGPDVAATPCPFLAGDKKFWDHEVREWSAPDSLEFLNRRLHRDTRVLKFSQLLLGRKAAPRDPGPEHTFRIVSPFEMNKGGFAFSAVTREGTLVKIDIPNRGLSKSDCKRIANEWERGDIAGCEEWKPLSGEHSYRIEGIHRMQKVRSPG